MATITIKNIDRLTKRLKNISDMDLKQVINNATTRVHSEAKTLAPVDTGVLSESIHMKVKKTNGGYEGRVYTNLEYAMYVEFGTGVKGNGSYPYNIKGLNLTYKHDWAGMIAQPYMYPALKNSEKYINKLVKDAVKNNLRKNCKGGR